MKNFLRHISIELYMVLAIFTIGWITNFSEIINILNTSIGQIILTFGILWFIIGFSRIIRVNEWGYFFLSLICSFGTIIFGIALTLWGIGFAFIILAIYFLCTLSPISHYLDNTIPYIKIISISFVIGFFLIIIAGVTKSKYLEGTKNFDGTEKFQLLKFEQAKTNKNSEWYIECDRIDTYNAMTDKYTLLETFIGTYEDAIKYGKNKANDFNSENKNKKLIEDTIKPFLYIPDR